MPTPPMLPALPRRLCPSVSKAMDDTLLLLAQEAGAHSAVMLPAEKIVLSPEFRDICRSNQCGKYGKCWVCPPELPGVQTVMTAVRSYAHALWYQTVSAIEDSFDIEGMLEAGRRHAMVSQCLQEKAAAILPKNFLHLSCGGCHLCPSCTKAEGLPCRMPEKALPSLEGYCVDVYSTTKNTPLKYINGQNTVTYFGMILFS